MDGTKLIGPERYFSPGHWKCVRNQEIDKRQRKTESKRQKVKDRIQLSKNTLIRKSNETE